MGRMRSVGEGEKGRKRSVGEVERGENRRVGEKGRVRSVGGRGEEQGETR